MHHKVDLAHRAVLLVTAVGVGGTKTDRGRAKNTALRLERAGLHAPLRPASSTSDHGWKWVRYAVLDIPQCVLYNRAMLPAMPFELPGAWRQHFLT